MKDLFYKLEEKLLNPTNRKSPQEVAELLSDDFVEFGSSGKIYNKQQVTESLLQESPVQISITDFNTSQLTPDVVLVTYKAIKTDNLTGKQTASLRSSIWKLTDGKWKIVFHQGTIINFY